MTTIVAAEIKHKKKRRVIFACDSQVSTGYRKESMPRGSGKIVTNGDVTFGFAGSVRVLNILKHASLPKAPKSYRRRDIEKWAITKLIPAMRKALRNEEAADFSDGQAYSNSMLIVSVNNRLFEVSSNFAYTTNDSKVYSVGSGSSYALGALGAGASPHQAVQVAAYFDMATGGDIQELELT